MTNTFNYPNAQRMVRDCVCSRCWDNLVIYPDQKNSYYVWCVSCKEDTVGYVTKHYVDECRHNSLQDAKEAKQTLEDIGVLPKPEKKSNDDILKELGF